MALLFWDGFDSYSNMAQLAAARPFVNPYLSQLGFVLNLYTTGGRWNGGYVGSTGSSFQGTGIIDISSFATPTEMYQGRAVYITQNTASLTQIYENAVFGYISPAVCISVNNGVVSAWRGYSTANYLIGASAAVFNLNTWNFIETRTKISSSASTADGIVEVWLNNRKIISNTSCVTKTSNSSTYYNGVNISQVEGNLGGRTDDIYVLDTTGPAPWNERLGDCRIASITVTSDAGPNEGTTSTGNNSHYTVVDEIIANNSDYILFSAEQSGLGEMFTHSSLPNTNAFSILATSIIVSAAKTDAGNATFKIAMKSGASTYNSTTQYMSTSNTKYRQDWTTNPATSIQWTLEEWANANVGFYVV
jgi:hypothetical protein